ncbi:MAG: carboxypeptidase-like regulatory domain-containing protein [Paludibacteraceae bacterium]|nr:carboxypeptidase-like regulatory domain-containing protein [Paludibacteraceae bacterium]
MQLYNIRLYTNILFSILLLFCGALNAFSTTYEGRVVDTNGNAIAYATVYPEVQPELGTATNNDGHFSFNAILTDESSVIISFIGYEKKSVKARLLTNSDSIPTIILEEQPIALEETVIAAKASKQRNKRKQMAALLHSVYKQIEADFPDEASQYKVVSDVRMQSAGETWGMEQMIANIVVLPEEGKEGRDSIQFQGIACKRFFDAQKRAQADSILAGNSIERLEKKSKEKFMRKAAYAVDSGVVVHRTLFGMGNMRYDFEQAMSDLRHWSVSNESEGETVLTHTQKINKYLGCFKMTISRHYIVDSYSYAVRRFSEHAEVRITIPFGVKLNQDQLLFLNLLNMEEEQIEKFRLRKMRGKVDFNTIYQRVDGLVYPLEKNMVANMFIIGSKDMEIPIHVKATQRVTDLHTKDVKALKRNEITTRVAREIVEIY